VYTRTRTQHNQHEASETAKARRDRIREGELLQLLQTVLVIRRRLLFIYSECWRVISAGRSNNVTLSWIDITLLIEPGTFLGERPLLRLFSIDLKIRDEKWIFSIEYIFKIVGIIKLKTSARCHGTYEHRVK